MKKKQNIEYFQLKKNAVDVMKSMYSNYQVVNYAKHQIDSFFQ